MPQLLPVETKDFLTPMVPNGYGSVLSAAVPAFYSYSGFLGFVIIGEEIKNPGRTIPLTLLLTFLVVASIYTVVTLVLPGLIPWRELGTMVAPMGAAARLFLPEGFAVAITVSALLAAATSINVVVLTTSRSFFALARNQVYTPILAKLDPRTGEPWLALVLVGVLAVCGVAVQGRIVEYAAVNVIGLMLYGLVWALALLRLPAAFPEHYRKSAMRLKPRSLALIAGVKVIVSFGFLYIGIRDNPVPAMLYLLLLGAGAAYYFYRQRFLVNRGVSLDALLREEASRALEGLRN